MTESPPPEMIGSVLGQGRLAYPDRVPCWIRTGTEKAHTSVRVIYVEDGYIVEVGVFFRGGDDFGRARGRALKLLGELTAKSARGGAP